MGGVRSLGKQKPVSVNDLPKEEYIVRAQQLVSLSPMNVTQGRASNSLGTIPMGNYKGSVAFWDLDLAVVQPLVEAEQKHILGVLNGLTEGYDLVTVTTPVGALTTSLPVRGSITVPDNQVWYVNLVEVNIGVDPAPGAVLNGNWRCTQFIDPVATPDVAGGAFWPTNVITNALSPWDDEFHSGATILAITNKDVPLRLPPGSKITLLVYVTSAAASAAINSSLSILGYVGKYLVR